MLQILPPPGRSAMKGRRIAMLQTFPMGGSAMLHIFWGKVCNVAYLPGGGLQEGRSVIQHRFYDILKRVCISLNDSKRI